MLADVLKQREKEQQRMIQEDVNKYNHPYKRDTVIYFSYFHIIGGIETWIYNLAHKYEFSVVYDKADKNQIKRLNDLGVETIKNVGQQIECNKLLCFLFEGSNFIKAKERYLFIHGIYNSMDDIKEIPKYDKIYAVSKVAAESFEKVTGLKTKVLYNPVIVEPSNKPLIIGVFSRLSSEKGKGRIIYLLDKLKAKNKPFLMLIFTDLPFEYDDDRVIFIPPTLNPSGWMMKCDYICQLSDTEAGSLTIQEALKLSKPLIITKLPILEEFGINESNAKTLEFDMSNLDIDDLWNIPVVKNWKEPISKEWSDIMKKKVFREKYSDLIEEFREEGATKAIIFEPSKDKKKLEKTVIEIEPKKKTTRKKSDK